MFTQDFFIGIDYSHHFLKMTQQDIDDAEFYQALHRVISHPNAHNLMNAIVEAKDTTIVRKFKSFLSRLCRCSSDEAETESNEEDDLEQVGQTTPGPLDQKTHDPHNALPNSKQHPNIAETDSPVIALRQCIKMENQSQLLHTLRVKGRLSLSGGVDKTLHRELSFHFDETEKR